ncbi:MAG TPA: ATP-binding protein [Candidatus Acidoferrales bacterium]|nr:ATP-binding protein [Candidatus Acidoferrales bacterium]
MPSLADSAVPEPRYLSRRLGKSTILFAGRILTSLGLVAAITILLFRYLHVNATTAGFFYLVVVLVIASAGGLVESTVASISAMLCFNYFFLPPIGTFTIENPQNWVALFAFLFTSLMASQLSARAKRRTKEAISRQHEMEKLYSFSRALLLADPGQPIAHQVVQRVAQAFDFPVVALYDRGSGAIYKAAEIDIPEIEGHLREAALRSTTFRDEKTNLTVTPIRLGGEPIGSLAVAGSSLSDAALQSLLNLAAIGLERAISQAAVNRAEIARQSEELKSTLLDAIAHEFKTPLTSIKAVTTGLLSDPAHDLRQPQRELVTIADESADRLSKLVTEAIQLARTEGGTFRLNRGVHFVSSLVSASVRQMKSLMDGREIIVSVADNLPPVWVDADLIQMVIAHLLDNALKYSPSGSPVSVSARQDDGRVVVSVADGGPGISEQEQSRIFKKFYKGKSDENLKGTGMGLSIAREVMSAHGQEILVASQQGKGSEFFVSLPVARGVSGK